MLTLRPERPRAERAVAPGRAASQIPPKRHWAEVGYAYVTLLAVAINWPWIWTNRSDEGFDVEVADPRSTILFMLLFATAALLLTNDWPTVVRIARGEPLLVALLFLAVVSTLWSFAPAVTVRRSLALSLSALFAVYLVVRFPLPRILRMVAWVVLLRVVLDFVLIFGAPEISLTETGLWQGRASGKNDLGRDSVLACTLMIWQVLSVKRGRLIFSAGAIGALVLILGSESTTAFVSAILLVVAIPLYQLLRARKTLFGAVIVTLGGGSVLGAAISLSQLPAITRALGKDVTLTGRTTIWLESIQSIVERPLLGFGYNGFWLGWFSPAHDIWVALAPFQTPHAHNGLIDVMLELGVLGGVLYSGILLRGVVRAIRFCRIHPSAAGLFPLGFLALSVLASSTEHGIMTQNSLLWVLFVATVCVLTTTRGLHIPAGALSSDPPPTPASPEQTGPLPRG